MRESELARRNKWIAHCRDAALLRSLQEWAQYRGKDVSVFVGVEVCESYASVLYLAHLRQSFYGDVVDAQLPANRPPGEFCHPGREMIASFSRQQRCDFLRHHQRNR